MDPDNSSNQGTSGGKPIRLLRPSIVILCGPAACGKSTFAKRHFRPTQVVSSDWARALVCDDERDQRYNTQAFALVHFLIEQRLAVNRLCVVDSTALTGTARRDLLDLAKKYQVPTTTILFNTPLATCLDRDAKRERSVGSAVIERQYEAFEQSKAAIRQEGFDQVLEFQDPDIENVQIEILFRPVVRTPQRPQRTETGAPRRFGNGAPPPPARPSAPRDGSQPVTVPAAPPQAGVAVPIAQATASPKPVVPPASAPTTASATPRAVVPAPHPPTPSLSPSGSTPTGAAPRMPMAGQTGNGSAKPAPPAAPSETG